MTRAERWASRVLLAGGVVGVALMVLGAAASALGASRGLSLPPIATAGMVLLLATPGAGVGAAAFAFALDGDRRFVAVCAVVLAMLVISLWVGGA